MDTSTTTLLPRCLSSLGKLDKTEYVEQYIRSQKSTKTIPERTYCRTDASNSTPRCDLSSITKNNAVHVGFDTPVLKARAIKVDILDLPSSSRKHTDLSDHDTEKRLAYRRKKKKAKREIVDPKKVSKDGEFNALSGSKAVAKRNKFSGVSLGLPTVNKCMNANIGSSRLTIEPSLRTRVGVFSKGRTSTKREREKSSKKIKRNEVSATRPQKTRNTDKSTGSDVTSLSENSSTDASFPAILHSKQSVLRLKYKTPNKPKEILNSFHVESGASDCYSHAGSVVWDIEKENFSFTGVSSVANHAARETDVTDNDDPALKKSEDSKDSDISIPADVQRSSEHNSNISLRPSESASQLKNTRELHATAENTTETKESKYFTCAAEQAVHMTFDPLPESDVLSNINLTFPGYSGSPNYFYCDTGSPAPKLSHAPSNVRPVYSEIEYLPALDISLSVEDWLPLRHEDEIRPSHGGVSSVSAFHLDQFGVGVDGEYAFSDSVTIPDDSEQGNDYLEGRGCSNMNCIDCEYPAAVLDIGYDPLASFEDYPSDEDFDACYGEQRPEFALPQRSVHSVHEDRACTSSDLVPSTWLPHNFYDGTTDYIEGAYRNSKANVELDVAKSLKNHWLPQKL